MKIIVKPNGTTKLHGITNAEIAAMDTPTLLAEQERIRRDLARNYQLGMGQPSWFRMMLRQEHHVLKNEGLRIAAELARRSTEFDQDQHR